MIRTGYYNSINGDRKYNAETMSYYFSGLLTRGVLQNYKEKFVVTATGEGMKVKVPTGKAFFSDGKWIENTADLIITLDPAEVTLNKIARIVLRNDKNNSVRNASIIVKYSQPATNPVAPELIHDEYVEEMCIAEIRINKLVETITQSSITNTIGNNSLCGYVNGLIDQVSTEEMYLQYQKAMQEYLKQSRNEFDTWFEDVREDLSTATLLREYTDVVYTTVQDQTDIPINEANYNKNLDVLEVHVNGLRFNEGTHYEDHGTFIRLKQGLDINQEVQLVIMKSVDGYNAESLVEEVEKLTTNQQRLMKYKYFCNGVNDNELLTELAQNFLAGTGEFGGVSAYAEMVIDVQGFVGAEVTVKGTGTSTDPYVWFSLGKIGDTEASTRKITFDFTNTDRITLGSADNSYIVVFDGNEVNLKGLNLVIGGNAVDIKWFNGQKVNVMDSHLYLNGLTTATGSAQGGSFERCRLSVTGVNGKAVALNSNGTTPIKAIDCEILCYNSSSISDESVAILGEANKTEGVVIVERCNIPLRSRGGYKQSQTIKINSGFCSLVSNMLGKAPAIYKPTDTSMVTNVGSMIVSK